MLHTEGHIPQHQKLSGLLENLANKLRIIEAEDMETALIDKFPNDHKQSVLKTCHFFITARNADVQTVHWAPVLNES